MAGLTWIEIIYWASTIIGGTLFILRVILMFLGGSAGDDALDSAIDSGADTVEADVSFKLMSIQGLTSFFMMFGLVGLALFKAGLAVFLTVLGGMVAGLVTVAITGLIFSQMKRLQSEGTINIQNTIGTEGNVYLTIPKNGTGQVQVIAQGSLKIFNAVSSNKNMIATGEKVQVVGVSAGNTLIVEKAK